MRLDVVERVGAVRVPRELHLLPRRELGEELARELGRLVLEPPQLGLEGAVAARELAQLAHARDELDDGLLEGEDVTRGHRRRGPADLRPGRPPSRDRGVGFSRRTLKRRIGFSLPFSERGSISSNSKRPPSARASPR